MEHQEDGIKSADIATESMSKMTLSEEEQPLIDNNKCADECESHAHPESDEILCNEVEDSQDVASRCSNEERASSSGRRSPSVGNETETDTKSSRVPEYCEGPPSSADTYNTMYNIGPETGTNNSEVLQDIPGLPAEKLLECRHDIISSTSINPSSHQHYGPGNDSPCYFLSSSQQIFTVVESVVHFLTQPVVNFIRGEWIVSFMPFPIAQHVCISLDDGMKRYEEVLRVQPNVDNPTKVDLITVEHRLVSGNTMHRPRFKEALRQSLTEIGKQLSGEAPWEIFVSRASGRALGMDSMIHSFLSESHEPLETHCSPLVEHSNTPIFARLTAAPYIIVGSVFRPILRYASWLLVSSHYQLHETITLNLNYKTRRIEATSLDSALAKSSYTEELGPGVVLLDAVSYVNDAVTGNAVLSNNTLLGRNLHPFLNYDNNPILNRGINPCFNSTFAPPSNTSNPVSSVGLIITPPGHPPHLAGHQNLAPPHAPQHGPGNYQVVNAYPAPLFSYSPYGLLQQVVPPIPIVPENFYPAPPFGHYMERPDLMLNPNAQDFFPDAEEMQKLGGNHPNNFVEQGLDSVSQQSNSETSLQKQHCQPGYVLHPPANFDSELTLVMIRARESQSDLANNISAARTHSKSWSEETEGGEHDLQEQYTYANPTLSTYEEQPLIVEAAYKNVNEWKSSNQSHVYVGDHNGGNNWQRCNYGNQKYHSKGGHGDKYTHTDGSENYHQAGVEYAATEENAGNYNQGYQQPRRRDHYNRNFNKNYYGGGYNKPRYNNSNNSSGSNDRYNSGNSYSRGNETSQSQSSQQGNYGQSERGRGNYHGRNRTRGRSYQQRSNNSSNN